MRIWVLSDLHVDVHAWSPPDPAPDCDVLVVAGDVGERLTKRVLPWLARNFAALGRPVVYVPGNHDFYRSNYDREVARAPDIARELGITLLLDGSGPAVLGGVRFVGATLWTDFRIHGNRQSSLDEARRVMNDHRLIRAADDYRRFAPQYAEIVHRRALSRLDATLAQPFDGATVVVTHHAPAPPSLDDREPRGPLDGAYVSDLTGLIEARRPDLWIHGHVHRRRDYGVGLTRIVANPRGYVTERTFRKARSVEVENPDFDPALVVDVAPRR